jgi:hypothetical protein
MSGFQPVPCPGRLPIGGTPFASRAGFDDRLDRHFERKIVWMSTAPAIIAQ